MTTLYCNGIETTSWKGYAESEQLRTMLGEPVELCHNTSTLGGKEVDVRSSAARLAGRVIASKEAVTIITRGQGVAVVQAALKNLQKQAARSRGSIMLPKIKVYSVDGSVMIPNSQIAQVTNLFSQTKRPLTADEQGAALNTTVKTISVDCDPETGKPYLSFWQRYAGPLSDQIRQDRLHRTTNSRDLTAIMDDILDTP